MKLDQVPLVEFMSRSNCTNQKGWWIMLFGAKMAHRQTIGNLCSLDLSWLQLEKEVSLSSQVPIIYFVNDDGDYIEVT
jgi:hypothetical protein